MRRTGLWGRFYGSGGVGSGLKPELKYLDQNIPGDNWDTPEVGRIIQSINLVPQGNSASEMIGKQIVVKKIQVRMSINKNFDYAPNADNLVNAALFRMCVVLDTQCNGTQPTWADVMESQTLYSMPNISNSKRFRILKEWTWEFKNELFYNTSASGTVPVQCGNHMRSLWFNKKCNIPIEFSGQAGAVRDINEVRSNNIFIIGATESNVPESDMFLTQGRYRIRYYD